MHIQSIHKFKQSFCLKTMWKFWHTIAPPRVTLEPHAHKHHEQIYFIIEGTGIVSFGEEKQRVNSGDAIYQPPDINHGFVNDSEKPYAMICVGANISHEGD